MRIQEVIDGWNGHWFQISPNRDDEYVYIFSPEMEKSGHTSEEIEAGFQEFLRIEEYIKSCGKAGWVACTDLKNDHIMLYMASFGARPFNLNIDENAIYFIKELKNVI